LESGHPKLNIEGLSEELEPVEYREDLDGGALAIHARVRVSRALGEALRRLWWESRTAEKYLNVVRVGLDEEPRQMRFGQPLWSQHDDHEKHEVILVDRAYDEGRRERWPVSPGELKQRGLVIKTAEQMDSLLKVIVERGCLSQQDVERVRNVSEQRMYERLLDLLRVDDLDEWE
jgi:hypothetical protein